MNKVKFKIIDGGKAIPIGNNLYKLIGRSHEEGGIGIELKDGNAKTVIEGEDKEIFEPKNHEFRVLSNSIKIGNKTPAQLAEAGYNPDIIFKAQQSINGNYGGNYAENGSKKYTYIGGTPEESRKKYYEFDTKLTDIINAISKEYDIAPELLFHRLSKEGIIDRAIQHNNENYFRNKKYNENNEFISIIDRTTFDPFVEIGLDDGFDNYDNYNLKRNIPIAENKKYNEKGRLVNSVQTANVQDAIELMAAELNYRKNILAKNGINPTNALISASYNKGINGVIDSNNKGNLEKEYSIPNTYNSLIRDIKYKPDDRFMNTDYVDQVHKNLQEMNDSYIVTHKHDKNNKINYFNNNYKNHFKGIDEKTINNILNEFLKLGNGSNQSYDIEDAILLNDVEKLNTSDITLLKNKYKNGGQINMKLKHKNKQDITDMVMNEILPHSTGERKKFDDGGVWGTSEWSLAGNLGLNVLNALTQGILGSVFGNKAIDMYTKAKSKLKKTFTPVAREYIDTRVDIENELSGIKQSTAKLIENAKANTSNAKVARLQAQNAIKQQNELEHRAYTNKYKEESNRRNIAAELATKYNIIDNQNYIQSEREYQDKMLQLDLGIANAEISKGQTWGNAVGSALKAGADSLTDYATMTNDLLKSNNSAAYVEYMKRNYGHFLNSDGTLKDKYKGNTRIENFYNKNLKPLFSTNILTPTIIPYSGGLLT